MSDEATNAVLCLILGVFVAMCVIWTFLLHHIREDVRDINANVVFTTHNVAIIKDKLESNCEEEVK